MTKPTYERIAELPITRRGLLGVVPLTNLFARGAPSSSDNRLVALGSRAAIEDFNAQTMHYLKDAKTILETLGDDGDVVRLRQNLPPQSGDTPELAFARAVGRQYFLLETAVSSDYAINQRLNATQGITDIWSPAAQHAEVGLTRLQRKDATSAVSFQAAQHWLLDGLVQCEFDLYASRRPADDTAPMPSGDFGTSARSHFEASKSAGQKESGYLLAANYDMLHAAVNLAVAWAKSEGLSASIAGVIGKAEEARKSADDLSLWSGKPQGYEQIQHAQSLLMAGLVTLRQAYIPHLRARRSEK